MRQWWLALGFLTRFPVPNLEQVTEHDIAKSARYFPFVGLLIGALTYLLVEILHLRIQSPAILAWAVLLSSAMITGALHLDGLMDTFDGILSARSRERMLEIMRDSRVGAMGVVGAVLLLLGKYSTLEVALNEQSWLWLVWVPMFSRAAVLLVMQLFPYARKEGGLGTPYIRHHNLWNVTWPLLLALTIAGSLGTWSAMILGVTIVVFSLLIATWISRILGGVTGDVYGAIIEIGELVGYLFWILWGVHG